MFFALDYVDNTNKCYLKLTSPDHIRSHAHVVVYIN